MSRHLERLESRVLLSAADIDLTDLLARAASPTAQTSGIVDSAGNEYRFSEDWGSKPDEHTPRPRVTLISKVAPSGTKLWTRTFYQKVSIKDVVFHRDDLWVLGKFDSVSVSSGVGIWRFSDDPARDLRVPQPAYAGSLFPQAIEVDRQGNAIVLANISYSLGSTPVDDILISKVSSSGSMLWTQTIRGNGYDAGGAIATSASGEVVLAGETGSTDLPGAVNAADGRRFVTRFAATGELIASVYVSDSNHALVRRVLASDTYGTNQNDTIIVAPATLDVGGVPKAGFQVTVNGIKHPPLLPPGNLVIVGGPGNDHIVISPEVELPVIVYGGGGDDTILGGSGPDTLIGGAGDDVLAGRLGNDSLEGGDGNDLIEGGEGNDTLSGDGGNDTLYGQDGDDRLVAGYGDNELYGNAGNDTLKGGQGADYLTGNAGTDLIEFMSGTSTGYSERYLQGQAIYMLHNRRLSVTGSDDRDVIIIIEQGGHYRVGGWAVPVSGVGEIVIDAGADGDWIELSIVSIGATIFGGAGDDKIHGTSKGDLIYGNGGNDLIFGDDSLLGGSGDDTIYGNFGDDTISGMGGNDRIFGGLGNDVI